MGAGAAGGTLESAGSSPSTSAGYVKVSETSSRIYFLCEGTPSPSGIGLQCSWGKHTAGRVAGCRMRPRYEVPLTCWECEGEGLAPGAPGRVELGDWKDLCPLHAATVSYVLMADTEDSFRQWYEEACRDLGDRTALTAVEAQGRLLKGLLLEPAPAELNHSTDGGRAALFCHSCLSMVRSEWRGRIQQYRTELF